MKNVINWTVIESQIKLMIYDGYWSQDEMVYQIESLLGIELDLKSYKHLVALVEINLNKAS